MAKVWFAIRRGTRWLVPDGRPHAEAPFGEVRFRLDIGPQRRQVRDLPRPVPGLPPGPPETMEKVFVEVEPADLDGGLFPGFSPGWYDSPYSPAEAARRLSAAAKDQAA